MASAGPSARVLLVEDDLPLAGIVSKHLKARGHETRVAESAEQASETIRSGFRPTIVLLDINLPGDSGWASCAAAISMRPATRRSSW
jgi:DNA-binding response OmpR family regulator